MDEFTPFIFKDLPYYAGTIVEVDQKWKQNFRFNTVLKFIGYNKNEDTYCFITLHDNWTIYRLSNAQVSLYINRILKEVVYKPDNNNDMDPKYIDGIVSAWTWYIIIMLFAFFVYGIVNKICIWIVATFIFFNWRHKKIKGG